MSTGTTEATAERRCRCEATMPPEVLEGFSCGLPGCWRAPLVAASFDAYVETLWRARGEERPVVPQQPVVTSG